jgi:hypothetical protein
MSKCQKNKYFNVSGGSSQCSKTQNTEFSASLASLMNARESQDRMFSSAANVPQNQQIVVSSTPKPQTKDNSQIIDIILAGDFE